MKNYKDFLLEKVNIMPEKGVWKLPDGVKNILSEIINTVKGNSFDMPPQFFNSGYKGVSFRIHGKNYTLMYDGGNVGLEDQSIGRIYLLQQGDMKPIWEVKAKSKGFGDVNPKDEQIKEAKKLFKNWVKKTV